MRQNPLTPGLTSILTSSLAHESANPYSLRDNLRWWPCPVLLTLLLVLVRSLFWFDVECLSREGEFDPACFKVALDLHVDLLE